MSEYDDTDKGAIFQNDRKKQANHPDYTGKLNAGGTEYYVSAWVRETRAGKPMLSMALKEVYEQPSEAKSLAPAEVGGTLTAATPAAKGDSRADTANKALQDGLEFDDEIPF